MLLVAIPACDPAFSKRCPQIPSHPCSQHLLLPKYSMTEHHVKEGNVAMSASATDIIWE